MQTSGTATVVTFPDGTEVLYVDILIDCRACSALPIRLRLAGHHLRAVRDLLAEFIDMHPELTGKDGEARVVSRHRWSGQSSDPLAN
jgi:hypothetical protein